MYAFNLTGELDQMRRRHDLVRDLGGTCIMASLNSVGLVGMIELGRFSELPIHAHRNGWGYLSRAPMLGWSYVAWQKLWRLAGADHMHVNGLQSKFCGDGRERDRLRPGLPDADVRMTSHALRCRSSPRDNRPSRRRGPTQGLDRPT